MSRVLSDFDAILAPIAGKDPQGEDIKYDPKFFELKGQIEAISSGSADWKAIEALCVELLTQKSKDLNLVAYLVAALTKRHALPGFCEGVEILAGMSKDHWGGIHPRSPKRQGAALEWMVIRVTDYVEGLEVQASDRESLTEVSKTLQKLDQELKSRLGPDAASLVQLMGALQALLRRLPQEAPPPEPKPAPAAAPASADSTAANEAAADPSAEATPQAATPAPAPAPAAPAPAPTAAPAPTPAPRPSTPVELPKDAPLADGATVQEIKNRFRGLIAPLRKADPGNVLVYRLSRLLKWAELAGPPPRDAKKGGYATMVPVPRQQSRNSLDALLQAGQWSKLLEAAESNFQQDSGTFWLDLQRFTVTALEGIGARDAAEVVIEELRKLLERWPSTVSLCFAGGEIPFADPETKRWIEESVRKMDMKMLSVGGGGGSAGSMLEDEETVQIREMLAKKNLGGALDLLQGAVDRAPDVASRFHTRLSAAQLFLEANRLSWARNLVEDLAREAAAFDFETWQPQTAVHLFHLQALCYGRLAKAAEGEEAERLKEDLAIAQSRLFRLDLRPIALIEDTLGDEGRGSWWRLRR